MTREQEEPQKKEQETIWKWLAMNERKKLELYGKTIPKIDLSPKYVKKIERKMTTKKK